MQNIENNFDVHKDIRMHMHAYTNMETLKAFLLGKSGFILLPIKSFCLFSQLLVRNYLSY